LTVAEVAERLAVCSKTIRRWISAGELHHHRLGSSIRVLEEDLNAFLAARRR
jgi:excisionase family DNA binding protein